MSLITNLIDMSTNDIFSWTYDDLKGFDPILFQHTIDLIDNVKPVRQK